MNYKNLNDNELLYYVSDNNSDGNYYIYKKYEPIVLAIAKKKYDLLENRIYDFDDLVQYGYIGLQRAIDNFNQKRNVLFYTFAVYCINKEISKSIFLSNNRYSRTSAYKYSLYDDKMYFNIESDDNNIIEERILEEKIYRFNLTLDFDSSSVFLLRISGFSYNEIALLLDIKIKRVDYIIQKSKNKLKKYLCI